MTLVSRISVVPPAEAEAESWSAGAALVCVDAFLHRLVDLPLAHWLAIGEALVADREYVPVRQRAWDKLESDLNDRRLGVAAWQVRDAVDTAAHIASRESHHWLSHDRACFAAAHGAAEAAALALLARDQLPIETYRALTAPFAACVAAAESARRG